MLAGFCMGVQPTLVYGAWTPAEIDPRCSITRRLYTLCARRLLGMRDGIPLPALTTVLFVSMVPNRTDDQEAKVEIYSWFVLRALAKRIHFPIGSE